MSWQIRVIEELEKSPGQTVQELAQKVNYLCSFVGGELAYQEKRGVVYRDAFNRWYPMVKGLEEGEGPKVSEEHQQARVEQEDKSGLSCGSEGKPRRELASSGDDKDPKSGVIRRTDRLNPSSRVLEEDLKLASFIELLRDQAAINLESDLGILVGSYRLDLSVEEAAHILGIPNPLVTLDDFIDMLEKREKDVLLRRILSNQPRSLEALGKKWKITRERVRQIEGKIIEQLDSTINDYGQLHIDIVAHWKRYIINIDILEKISLLLADGVVNRNIVAKVVRRRSGPWVRLSEKWVCHKEVEERVKSMANRVGDRSLDGYTVSNQDLYDIGRELFLSDEDFYEFFEQTIGLPHIGGVWAIRKGKKYQVAAALRALERPATKEEIGELVLMSPGHVGNCFSVIEGVVRADKERWGFEEWVEDKYEGIVKEIEQRIEENGGAVELATLLDELPRLFGVSEQSVRSYALSNAFVICDGLVRKNKSLEYHAKDPGMHKDAVKVGDLWGQKIILEERFFRGYSFGISCDIAYPNGIRPKDNRLVSVVGTDHEVSVIWRVHNLNRNIDVGRVSPVLEELQLSPGNEVVVVPSPRSVEIIPGDRVEDSKKRQGESGAAASNKDSESSKSAVHGLKDPLLKFFE